MNYTKQKNLSKCQDLFWGPNIPVVVALTSFVDVGKFFFFLNQAENGAFSSLGHF